MLIGLINIAMLGQHFVEHNKRETIAEIHVQLETLHMIVQTVRMSPSPYPKGIALSWRRDVPVKFCGFPLVITSHKAIQPGGFLVRPERLADNPEWIEVLLEENAALRAKKRQEQASESSDREVLSSEAFDGDEETATDVLIKSATNCDDTRAVAVFKLTYDGDVKIDSNMTKFEMMGMLQDTLRNMMMS